MSSAASRWANRSSKPCMKSGGDHEACRAKASPAVKACVQKAMTAAHGRPNAPVAIPTEKSDPELDAQGSGGWIRRAAAHDQRHHGDPRQREAGPGPDQRAEGQGRCAAADRAARRRDLAWFYYGARQRARAARTHERCDRRRQQGDGDRARGGRRQHDGTAAAVCRHAIRASRAIRSRRWPFSKSQIRDTNVWTGQEGFCFDGLQADCQHLLIQMGDIEQADAYLRRSQALASGSPDQRYTRLARRLCHPGPGLGSRSTKQSSRHDFRGAGAVPRGRGRVSAGRAAATRLHQRRTGSEKPTTRKPDSARRRFHGRSIRRG